MENCRRGGRSGRRRASGFGSRRLRGLEGREGRHLRGVQARRRAGGAQGRLRRGRDPTRREDALARHAPAAQQPRPRDPRRAIPRQDQGRHVPRRVQVRARGHRPHAAVGDRQGDRRLGTAARIGAGENGRAGAHVQLVRRAHPTTSRRRGVGGCRRGLRVHAGLRRRTVRRVHRDVRPGD